jgi:2-oxoisovalerate dehydrogenase E2 component (dihydrolipoyl transacylase)
VIKLIEVKLHDIGEGMTEGEVLAYFVKVGDQVVSDQPIVEVQTDKMTAELPSPVSGTVKEILVEAGTNVEVGTTLLLIDSGMKKNHEEKKQPEVFLQRKAILETKKESSVSSRQGHSQKVILAAPFTRKIARELGIDLGEITGTGPAGRITDEDVHGFVNRKQEEIVHTKAEKEKEEAPPILPDSKREVKTLPFKGRRKQIASKMTKSLYTIPHVTHFEEVDVTSLLTLRSDWKEQGKTISVAAFFIKSLQLALDKFPIFNARLDEEQQLIRFNSECNIGVAVDTEEGLIVPVIHHVGHKSIREIHSEMKELIRKAQSNELTSRDISGGTFTMSNVGPLGGIGATPIINFPEVALISFHKTKQQPVVRNNEIVIRSMMNISMSFDHRVADGATAVGFTNYFSELIENPASMLLELT